MRSVRTRAIVAKPRPTIRLNLHLHFVCERCHRTLCLPDVPIPIPQLPDGFVIHTAGYVVRGICADCAARSRS